MLSRFVTVVVLGVVGIAAGEYYSYDGRGNNLQHAEWGFVRVRFCAFDFRL